MLNSCARKNNERSGYRVMIKLTKDGVMVDACFLDYITNDEISILRDIVCKVLNRKKREKKQKK